MRQRTIATWWIVLGIVNAASAAGPIRRPEPPGKPGFDARLPIEEKDRGGFVLRAPSASQRMAAEALEAEMPGMTLRWDGFSGSPKWIAAAPGSVLAPATSQLPEVAARAFLTSRAALFGLSPGEVERLRLLAVLTTPARRTPRPFHPEGGRARRLRLARQGEPRSQRAHRVHLL